MKKKIMVLLALIALFVGACKTPMNPGGPADHTVNRGGVLHKTGLSNPLANCVSCHGNDLQGGTSGISGYRCHGQKW